MNVPIRISRFYHRYFSREQFLIRLRKFQYNSILFTDSLVKRYRLRRRKILSLDMYNWTDTNITGFIKNRYGDQVVILNSDLGWAAYESGTPQMYDVNRENYMTLEYDGLLLWELCKVSIIKYQGKLILPGRTTLTEDDLHCISRFYSWAINCMNVIGHLLNDTDPDVVVLTQGGVYDSRIIAELCRRNGITAIALENSLSSAHFYADSLTGQILNRHALALTGDVLNECSAVSVSTAESQVKLFFQQALASKEPDHQTGNAAAESDLASMLCIPGDSRIILFLGQVRTDGSIILDSTVYPDPVMLVEQLIMIMQGHPDYFLIVRLHPKEDTCDRLSYGYGRDQRELCYNATLKELNMRGITSSDRLRIVSDRQIDTYALMKLSNIGITINSQSGLEMALFGKPVITAGRCFYAGKGFTRDLVRPQLLEAVLADALNNPQTTGEYTRLLRFCHYLFFDYLIPKDLSYNTNRLARLIGLEVNNEQSQTEHIRD